MTVANERFDVRIELLETHTATEFTEQFCLHSAVVANEMVCLTLPGSITRRVDLESLEDGVDKSLTIRSIRFEVYRQR